MTVHDVSHAAIREIEDLFPRCPMPLVSEKAINILQSHLITGFEAALDLGLPPQDALAVILSWVSSELGRAEMEHRSNGRR